MNFRTLLLTNIGTTNSIITDTHWPLRADHYGRWCHCCQCCRWWLQSYRFTSSGNLRLVLGIGLGSVLMAGLTSVFRSPAKFISQWLKIKPAKLHHYWILHCCVVTALQKRRETDWEDPETFTRMVSGLSKLLCETWLKRLKLWSLESRKIRADLI